MIYLADPDGRISGVITAHAVGYTDILDAAGVAYVKTEDRVDIGTHWIDANRNLLPRAPALVSDAPPAMRIGDAWTLPMAPARTRVTIDGQEATTDAAGPIFIEPAAPGVYDVAIDPPGHMPSQFVLTVMP